MLRDIVVPEGSSCKYLGIILRSDLIWADQFNFTVKKFCKSFYFATRVLKEGNSSPKRLAHTSLERPIVECGAACWDSYRKEQIDGLDRVQNKAVKVAQHRNDSNWETLAQGRMIAGTCALCKVYTGEEAWKAMGDTLQRPCYLSRVNNNRTIRSRELTINIGKYSFVNRIVQLWNKLLADTLGISFVKQLILGKGLGK
jgi:hypothetical protein